MHDVIVKRALKGVLSGFALAAFLLPGYAGVTVVQNVSPGATSWPGSPIVSTVSNPTTQATVPESFNGSNTNLGQTFTVTTTNYTLQTISVYAGAGNGGTITLSLYDLGTQTAPDPNAYSPSANLLGSGGGLSAAYSGQSYGVLKFDFTGSDQVTLLAGHMYAFELGGITGTTPIFWQRAASDTYSGGAAYRNRGWINGGSTRDFALAVYVTNSIPVPPPQSGICVVNWNDLRQRIDGFGGGTVFLNPSSLSPVTDANMDTLFGRANSNQLGLSLLRTRIPPDNNWTKELADAKKAVARGAGVLATPWTPPATMKDNNNTIGGSLLPAQYADYALYLKGFADYMSSNGASLKAISVQNEPDITVTYESCDWTATQLQIFFRSNAAAIGGTPVVMPESFQYNFALSDATLNDAAALTNVDIVAGHLYGNGDAGVTIADYANAHSKGKPTWMTEFLVNDQTIGTAIITAKQIHDCLTVGNMSAYIWWKCLGDINGLVNASGVPQKRGFVLAQFSRFVRPNYCRIGVATGGSVQISAYKDPNSSSFAIVAINTNTSTSIIQTFGLTNFNASTVTPWITSAALSLAAQSSISITNSSFTCTLPAMSVVTFVGQAASNSTPVLLPVASQTINAGITLSITNVAMDMDAPPQTLTFILLTAPTKATLTTANGTNGIFTWRPPVSQADTTNLVSVQVTDNGTPNLSATNSFIITVNPLAEPVLGSIAISAGRVSLTLNGAQGPDYTLLTATNLINWQPVFTTNSPLLPVTLVDTNFADAVRFYRIQLGP